jgi:hypothetical protein
VPYRLDMARAVTRCPGCGEPVSPFAAGCAICGTDLEAARVRHAGRRLPALAPRRLPRVETGLDPVHVAIAVVVAIAAPPFGLLLSLFWAVQRHRAGEPRMAVVMLAVALVSAAGLFAPVWFWTHVLNV